MWQVLGIAATTDRKAIRKAYAAWVFLIIGVNLLRVCSGPGSSPENVQPAPFTNPVSITDDRVGADADVAIDAALARLFAYHLPVATLRDKNPKLLDLLKKEWKQARDGGQNYASFEQRLAAFLTDRFERTVRRSDAKTLRRYWYVRLTMMLFQQEKMPDRCDVLFTMGEVPGIDPTVTARYVAVMAEVLTKGQEPETLGNQQFMIPGRIVEAARAQSKLPKDRFLTALRGDGNVRDLCETKRALIDVLLADQSPDATRILRNL